MDASVLVRLITEDDPEQAGRAAALVHTNDVFLSKTVLLETGWVLKHAYELDRAAVDRALRALVGLPRVTIEDRGAVLTALDAHRDGVELGDALHLASSRECQAMHTFDREFAIAAEKIGTATPVRTS